jgi:hypothetical protein
VGFAPEGDAAVAAATGFDAQETFIYETHGRCVYPKRPGFATQPGPQSPTLNTFPAFSR